MPAYPSLSYSVRTQNQTWFSRRSQKQYISTKSDKVVSVVKYCSVYQIVSSLLQPECCLSGFELVEGKKKT